MVTKFSKLITMKITHRRADNNIEINDRNHVILFAEGDKNSGYGEHVWELKTKLPYIANEAWVAEFIVEYYAEEGIEMTLEEAEELANPADIVDTAAVWDDHKFVAEFCYRYNDIAGFETADGAVVFNPRAVELEYTYEEE